MASPVASSARSARYVGTLRVLTVNDVYSPSPVDGCGGWAMLSTLLKQHRTPTSVLCINGDFLGGSALAEHHQGRNVVQIMNALGTDLVVLGNHEFDYGSAALKERMAESNFTWLGSNVREKATADAIETTLFERVQDLHQIRIELQREDIAGAPADPAASSSTPFPSSTPATVGLFGLCTPYTPQLSWPGPLVSFMPVNPVLEDCVARLRGHAPLRPNDVTFTQLPRPIFDASSSSSSAAPSADAATPSPSFAPSDAVVAVTHLSFPEDRKLARQYGSEVQLVIGGHDHDPIAIMESKTLVFKAGQNAEYLGIIDLRIEVTLTEKTEEESASAASSSLSPTSVAAAADPATAAFHRAHAVFPSWSMVASRGLELDANVQQLIDSSIAAMEKAAADEDQDEVVSEIAAPLALPPGMTLTPELQAALLVTKTSAVRKASSSFADMVADAMAYHYAEDGCSGAMINGGFIRGDRVYAQGTQLTLRDIRYELPFPKVAVLLRIPGRGIFQSLNEMLMAHPNPSGSYPHMSKEWTVDFDASNPTSKSKVTRVTHLGQPLDLDKIYKLSVTTFMASGGDGITGFSQYGTIISKDSHKVGDLVLKYLRGQKILHPNVCPRVQPTGAGLH